MPPQPLYSFPHVPLCTLVLPFCSLTFPSSPYVFTLQRYIDFWAFCSLCWHPQNASGVWTFSQKKKKRLVQYLFCPLPVIDPFFFPLSTHCCSQRCSQIPHSWMLPPPTNGLSVFLWDSLPEARCRTTCVRIEHQPLPEGTSTNIWGTHFLD